MPWPRAEARSAASCTRADLRSTTPTTPTASPACRPGRSPIPAAPRWPRQLRPGPVDYLYFVADGNGGHAFATTLAEHNRNVARWRKLRREGG